MVTKRQIRAAINRRRNARKLVGLANKGLITRAEANRELAIATRKLRGLMYDLEMQVDAPRWRAAYSKLMDEAATFYKVPRHMLEG